MWNGIFLPRQSINKANFLDEESSGDGKLIAHVQSGPHISARRVTDGAIEVDATYYHEDHYDDNGDGEVDRIVQAPSNNTTYTYRFSLKANIRNDQQAIDAIIEYHSNN